MKNWLKISVLAALIIGIVMMSGCTGKTTTSTQVVQGSPQILESPTVQVKLLNSNGILTADVTNQGSVARSFVLAVDVFDGNVKLNTFYMNTPVLKPGEIGRASLSFSIQSTRPKLSAVSAKVGNELQDVSFNVTYL